jgi:predicted nucleic acid-binding Zn ribbon protein
VPLYCYACAEGHVVEVQRKIDDRAKPLYCERCLNMRNETVEMQLQPSMTSPNFPGATNWRN